MARRPTLKLPLLAVTVLVAAGCGGGDDAGGDGSSKVTAQQRIDGCLTQQPDATRAECEGWEQDGELRDDGVHKDHASAEG